MGALGLADSPGHPLRQGFDDFLGYLHQVHAHFFYPFWLTLNHGRMNLRENEDGGRGQYSHDLLFERALDFVRNNRDGPFFCYLPVTIPHVELAVPADSLKDYLGQFPEVGGGPRTPDRLYRVAESKGDLCGDGFPPRP